MRKTASALKEYVRILDLLDTQLRWSHRLVIDPPQQYSHISKNTLAGPSIAR